MKPDKDYHKTANIPTGSPARGLKSAKSPLAFADAKSAKFSLRSVGGWVL